MECMTGRGSVDNSFYRRGIDSMELDAGAVVRLDHLELNSSTKWTPGANVPSADAEDFGAEGGPHYALGVAMSGGLVWMGVF